jgi:uncharacterized protein
MRTTAADIQDFLAQRRIAIVGVSRDSKDFSRILFREFIKRGYDVIPINPGATEVENRACFAHVQDIHPTPDAALLMIPSATTPEIVRECAAAGVHRVWMYRAGGQGAVDLKAVAFCRENEIRVVEGHCPFMFLPGTSFLHRAHGFILKLTGAYPKAA